MIGTVINTGAVVAGSIAGILIHSKLSPKVTGIVFQAIGLFTLFLGVSMALEAVHFIAVLLSLVTGAIAGQWIDIDKYLQKLTGYLKKRIERKKGGDTEDSAGFTEGFLTASMLFCVGSMSILGAIEEGTGQAPDLYFTKSIMDGISSVALASSFGISVIFSALPVLLYQGGLTLLASVAVQYMSDPMLADLSSTGGILLIGLAFNILKIKEISVVNMLPALIFIIPLSYFFA